MSLLQAGFGSSGGDYTINDSLRFRSSASAYLNRTFSTPTDNKKWTFSFWCKRGTLGTVQTILSSALSGNEDQIYFTGAADTFRFYIDGGTSGDVTTVAKFRDPSAWYHIIVVCDTANATATDRALIYVNGVRQTVTGTNFALNAVPDINGARVHYFGRYQSGAYYTDGYLTEVNFIDGQALTADDFGEYDDNGTWKPLAYTGTYGNNGFYLNGVGVTDQSGNGNNWTNNNLNLSTSTATTYDQMKDTPSLVDTNTGNFCTLNPLDKYSSAVIAEGNLKIGANNNSWTNQARSTFFVSSGKWYWEVTYSPGTGSFWKAGIRDAAAALTSNTTSSTGYEYYAYNGNKQATGVNSSYGSALTAGDVLGLALDMDAGTITAYKNNTSLGVMFSGLSGSYSPTVSMYNSFISLNFGQRPFKYTPPSGFLKLNTFNLPDSAIEKGSDYFNAVLYSGNGGTQSITGVNFKPDWTWLKCRNDAQYHILQNSVTGAGKTLFSNTTSAESGNAGDFISSFNSDGFTVNNTYAGGTNNTANGSGKTYVGWNWLASNTTATNSAGTNGATLASTYSANTTSGFSVVTYTGNQVAGATVYHGIGTAPSAIIVKGRNNSTSGWGVGHQSLGWGLHLSLQSTNATAAGIWNSTAPSANLFTLGISGIANLNNQTAVAYCFAEVPGYSAFGIYTGNGSTDGPFIFTGMRPSWLLVKRTNAAGNAWYLEDSSRNTYNPVNLELYPNLANAEATSTDYDFLSNGFKIRASHTGINANGGTYIYMAFAENPFKNSNAR